MQSNKSLLQIKLYCRLSLETAENTLAKSSAIQKKQLNWSESHFKHLAKQNNEEINVGHSQYNYDNI